MSLVSVEIMDGNRYKKTYTASRERPNEITDVGPVGPTGPQGVTDCTSVIRAMGVISRTDTVMHRAYVPCTSFVLGDIPIFVLKNLGVSQGAHPYVMDVTGSAGFRVQFSAGEDCTYYWILIAGPPVRP